MAAEVEAAQQWWWQHGKGDRETAASAAAGQWWWAAQQGSCGGQRGSRVVAIHCMLTKTHRQRDAFGNAG